MTEIHRGQWLKQKIKERKISVTTLADKMSIGYVTLYRWFQQKDLNPIDMKRIADIIKVDLSQDFPEFNDIYDPTVEPVGSYKSQYYKALEENNQLKSQLLEYVTLYGPLPGSKSGQ